MHIDQILLMIVDKDQLKTGRRLIKGTPQEMYAKGFLKELPDISYTQRVKQHLAEEQKQKQTKVEKRKRRRERREKLAGD
jgi:hypothetical protein